MEAKFKKGQSVRITKRNGEIIDGIIRDWDYTINNLTVSLGDY